MDEQFREHLAGIYLDLMDLEPMQQSYPPEVIVNEDDKVSLIEFIRDFYAATQLNIEASLMGIEVFFEDYYDLDFHYEQHPQIMVPYGPAFLAMLGDPKMVARFELNLHENAGVRLLVAHFTSSAKILDLLSYDRCCMVRAEVAENEHTSEKSLSMLAGDPFIHVRDIASRKLEQLEVDSPAYVKDLEISACVCNKDMEKPSIEEFFNQHGLDIPVTVPIFEDEATEFGEWHWATQPFPTRWQDYLMIETVEYLKGPIPDQYSINHAGHGVNSYSLNFRYALGDLAIFAQLGWGGVYMDSGAQESAWDELQSSLSSIMISVPTDGFDSSYIRKYLIVFSEFRIGSKIQFWVRSCDEWVQRADLDSFQAIQAYLESQYD